MDTYSQVNNKLKRGQQFDDISDIKIVGDLRMNIVFHDKGKIMELSHSVMHSNVDAWRNHIQGLLSDFYVKS